jgi:hypothetical protein
VPGASDDAVIASGNCEIDISAEVRDLTVDAGATLTFSGWTTVLTARDVSVNGTITHFANTATEPDGEGVWHPDMRVQLECRDLAVNAGGKIHGDQMGYGYDDVAMRGYGPGGGLLNGAAGAGHGAVGVTSSTPAKVIPTNVIGGSEYGVAEAPVEPGSGGGGGVNLSNPDQKGGLGGGAVRIQAAGTVTVSGTGSISANGGNHRSPASDRTSGGSGGSVYIVCGALAGNGSIAARGGHGQGSGTYRSPGNGTGCGGAGGRIAIHYDDTAQDAQNAVARPTIVFSAEGGRGRSFGRSGTVYFSGGKVLHTVTRGGVYIVEGIDAWSPTSLTVTEGFLHFPEGFTLDVGGNLSLTSYGALGMEGGALNVGGSVTLNQGGLRLEGAEDEVTTVRIDGDLSMSTSSGIYLAGQFATGTPPGFGLILEVGGHLTVRTACDIFPQSDPFNGLSARLELGALTLDSGGSFNAAARGYLGGRSDYFNGRGPGGGVQAPSGAQGGGGGRARRRGQRRQVRRHGAAGRGHRRRRIRCARRTSGAG